MEPLEELGEACRAIDGRWLHYWSKPMFFRITHGSYATGSLYTPDLEEADAMFGIAGAILREIQSRLPLETRASEDRCDHQT